MERHWISALSIACIGALTLACGGLLGPEVIVANGYDEPLSIAAGDETWEVPAHSTKEIKLPESPFTIEAWHGDVLIDSVSESCDLGNACVFNPAGRMVLASGEVHYGGYGEVPDDQVMPVQSYYRLGSVDYAFEEPPLELTVGTFEEKVVRVVYDLHDLYGFEDNFRVLLNDQGEEAAVSFLEAELKVHPRSADALRLYGEVVSLDQHQSRMRVAVEADPDNLPAHVQLQALMDWQLALAEYKALHTERNDAMTAYLYGRLLAADDDERARLLQTAAETIPDAGLEYAPTLALLGDPAGAVVAYEKALAMLPLEERRLWQRDRMRLYQVAGQPMPLDKVVADLTISSDIVYYTTVFGSGPPLELTQEPDFDDLAAQAYLALQRGDLDGATMMADEIGGFTAMDIYQAAAASDGADEELIAYVDSYFGQNLLLYPPASIPQAEVQAATEGSITNVGLYWVRAANGATNPKLRQYARDKARTYMLKDELPYWTY